MPSTSHHPLLNLPIITEEEERAERLALTASERLQLHIDVYGRPPLDNKDDDLNSDAPEQSKISPDTISRELDNLTAAIAALPDSEKTEYLEAQKSAPELVASESPPEAFLRREKLNVQAAAVRLLKYWKQRKELFGSDRAFLPLNLDGAMRDDLALINHALSLPLPNDNHGRPVLLWDRSGYDSASGDQFTPDAVCRVFLFIAHKAAYSRSKGLVILINMQALVLRNKRHLRSVAKQFYALIQGLPFRVLSIHICTGPGNKSVGELILPVLKYVYGRDLRLRTSFHSGTFREMLHLLEEFGMSEEQVGPLYASSAEDRQSLMQQWLAEHA